MSTIGSVIVDLKAQNAQFTQAVSEAKESLGGLGSAVETMKGLFEFEFVEKAIEKVAEGIKKVIETVAEWTNKAMETAESSIRTAEAIGIHTKALQELRTAGFLEAGVSAEDFDNILKKMEKNIGEASDSTSKAAKAYKELHLSVKDLQAAGTEEAFKKITAALHDHSNSANRSALTTDALTKAGMVLLPVIAEGAEGLQKSAEFADKYGIALNGIDTAKLAAGKEELNKLGLIFEGLKNQLAVAIIPEFTKMVSLISASIPPISTMSATFNSATRNIVIAAGWVQDAANLVRVQFYGIYEAVLVVVEGLVLLEKGLQHLANKIPGVHFDTTNVDAYAAHIDDLRKKNEKTINEMSFHHHRSNAESFDKISQDATKAAKEMQDKIDKITKDANKNLDDSAADKFQAFLDKIHKANDELKETKTQKLQDELNSMGVGPDQLEEGTAAIMQLQQKEAEQDRDKIKLEIRELGMSALDKKIDAYKEGHTDEQIASYTSLIKTLDEAEKKKAAGKKEDAEYAKIYEATLTPLDKFNEKLALLNKLKKDGYFDAVQYAAALKHLQDEMAKPQKALPKSQNEDHEYSLSTTRRFDFSTPGNSNKESREAKQAQDISAIKDAAWSSLLSTQEVERLAREEANGNAVAGIQGG